MRLSTRKAKTEGWNSLLMFSVLATVFLLTWNNQGTHAKPFELTGKDNFDLIMDKFMSVTPQNCRSKPTAELRLDHNLKDGVISQVPRYNTFLSTVYYNNRSNLLHAHNIALNRAFYYSYIYQALNATEDLHKQPGFEYIYFSLSADVSAGVGMINGSGIFFDQDCTYANWYTTLPLNQTLPLFAPKAWRADDYNEPTNWLREPTNNTIDIVDVGSGRGRNYTLETYRNNPWYDLWLPDKKSTADTLTKYTYTVRVWEGDHRYRVSSSFFGPPQPGSQEKLYLPVVFTDPYFDCGRSNKWIVSATAPVVEFMPRYSNSTHLRRARYVAVTSADLEFERIDFNPCPISEGNPSPNFFASTARCKPTTLCEPISGFGFRRGGYKCACLPGFRYPWWHDGPFLGVEIESATKEEYDNSFDCRPTDFAQVIPKEMPTLSSRNKRFAHYSYDSPKDRFLKSVFPFSYGSHRLPMNALEKQPYIPLRRTTEKILSRQKRDLFDNVGYQRMTQIINRKENVNKDNCKSKRPNELLLPGDAGFGAEKQFESQGRTALRLAHFLSNFLQNVDEYEEFGILRGDRRLHETQMFGEVVANVMGDFKILGSGIFFDRYKFRMSPIDNRDPHLTDGNTQEYFAPYAYKTEALATASVVNFAGFNDSYTSKRWFLNMKSRWATNYHSLQKYTTRPMIRSDINGTSSIRFEYYPLNYYATKYEDGEWLRPVFKCDGRVDRWVVTYVVPFFGKNTLKTSIEFKGVVTVDANLEYMDIDQCPADFYVANAFKNTAHCDFETTYCVPLQSHLKYQEGSYKCECKQGYEYPFNDLQWYFDGQTMVEEYSKKINGQSERFETLRCRIAGATHYRISWMLLLISLLSLNFFKL